ncbi:MAG: universal stress protein [Firmicutes bacterium]|jgi:nucleotide-binding universal stress UspA family protein|nr:universal stress protein [Bacillota bacterium]
MFNNILAPVDGSEFSLNAARVAASIANKYSGKLTLLHVISESLSNRSVADLNQGIALLRAEGSRILEAAFDATGKAENEVEKALSWGNPMEIILEEVANNGYDLIVMGSRGLSPIRGLLMGSVSERITRAATCPVLIVK